MARFDVDNTISHLAARFGHPSVVRRALDALNASATPDDADANPGPGWFDSSWELGRGLDVCEGLPSNGPLADWLAAGT